MKRLWSTMCVVVLLLLGCTGQDTLMERCLDIRSGILNARQIEFDCRITADYQQKLFTFDTHCSGDKEGNISFRITEPASIADITGTLSAEGGKLTSA